MRYFLFLIVFNLSLMINAAHTQAQVPEQKQDQQYSQSIFQMNDNGDSGYSQVGRNLLRIMKTSDFYLTMSGSYYHFPTGIRQTVSGTNISANDLKSLAEVDWGMTFWLGKVMFSQYFTLSAWQLPKVDDPQYQIQDKTGFASLSIGYTVHEIMVNNSPLRVRLIPIGEFGFGGIILPDDRRNAYMIAGAGFEVGCVLPFTDITPNPKTHTFSAVAAYLSIRGGYNHHFSMLDFTPSQGTLAARVIIGIGFHSGIDPNYQDQW